jgi:hypothetical protein
MAPSRRASDEVSNPRYDYGMRVSALDRHDVTGGS